MDLSMNALIGKDQWKVSLREEGVDLSLEKQAISDTSQRLPPRGGSGFKP